MELLLNKEAVLSCGIQVPIMGRHQPGSLPIPAYIGVIGVSDHDGKIFDQIRSQLHGNKNYIAIELINPLAAEDVRQARHLIVLTPVKKQKRQFYPKPQDQWLTAAVH